MYLKRSEMHVPIGYRMLGDDEPCVQGDFYGEAHSGVGDVPGNLLKVLGLAGCTHQTNPSTYFFRKLEEKQQATPSPENKQMNSAPTNQPLVVTRSFPIPEGFTELTDLDRVATDNDRWLTSQGEWECITNRHVLIKFVVFVGVSDEHKRFITRIRKIIKLPEKIGGPGPGLNFPDLRQYIGKKFRRSADHKEQTIKNIWVHYYNIDDKNWDAAIETENGVVEIFNPAFLDIFE